MPFSLCRSIISLAATTKRSLVYIVQPRLTQTSYNFNNTNNVRNMSNAPLLGRILANSVSLANKSAQIAREIMASGELGVTEKTGIDDLQTKADRYLLICCYDLRYW